MNKSEIDCLRTNHWFLYIDNKYLKNIINSKQIQKIFRISQHVFNQCPNFVQKGILHARFIAGSLALFSAVNIISLPIDYCCPGITGILNLAKIATAFIASGYTRNAGVDLNIETDAVDGIKRLTILWVSAYATSYLSIWNIGLNAIEHPFKANLIHLIYAPLGAVAASIFSRFKEEKLPYLVENHYTAERIRKEDQQRAAEFDLKEKQNLAARQSGLLRVRVKRNPYTTRF